ncbi:uncharacterized protein LOC105836417 [Monomorium pharaonis]|uniref:uncharacterized protein LOC105836417 n=1 Tax=Monomorium pharaonis TaxID=307658 RepID=UPI00063F02EC|nr:uncharacterized protein LOC105836417 [Monomorium pharaonis]
MSLTSRTNRWASRVIIILQLVTWNAVGVILLHRGVSTLRRRILETSDVAEVNPPTGLDSVVSSTRSDENEYLSTQQGSIDRNVEIIIRIDPDESPLRNGNKNNSGSSAIRSERLKDTFEIVSAEQRPTLFLADALGVPTTARGTPSSRLKNHLTEIDRRVDDRPEDKDVTSKISRIARDREHVLDNGGIIQEDDTSSILDRSTEEGEDFDFAENVTRATVRETSPVLGEEVDRHRPVAARTGKGVRLSRVNHDGATMAVGLVVIGAIMLLIGPVVIILRILDERRRARKSIASPARMREDLPPTYEQAVLMDEAPRYSTLDLNYDRTPPPSPTLSSTVRLFERRDVVVD